MAFLPFKRQFFCFQTVRYARNGKIFFVYGTEVGACSRKVEEGMLTDPVVSRVCNAETGEMFMMLHQRGEGGAPTLAIF